jgi:hypothetical protein
MGQAINTIEYRQHPQNIVSLAMSLPTLAALAWHHNKVDYRGRTFGDFERDVWNLCSDRSV